MGCGESKHDSVAAGNTILRRKQSSKKKADDQTVGQENPTAEKVVENAASTAAAADSAPDPHVEDQTTAHEHHAKDVASRGENDVASTVAEAKDLENDDNDNVIAHADDNTKISEDNHVVDDDHRDRSVISRDSPNHFFSPRNDQEELGIDGIITDGRSGKSEYNTPPRESSAESINRTAEDLKPDGGGDDQNNNGDVGTDQNVDDHRELATDGDQSKAEEEDQTGKSGNVEENTGNEELEVSIPAVEENTTNTPNAEEKHVVDSPTKELKTV